MDSEALKIILNLKEQNIIYRRAILDAALMLSKREEYCVIQYDYEFANCLNLEVSDILRTLNKSPNNTKGSDQTA